MTYTTGRFAIMRGGEYVSRPGSARSYTRRVEDSARFATREEARRNACDNERVVDLQEQLRLL